MAFKLYNTRTRIKEDFQPLDPSHVRMYVCGPTVYNYAHIGNARPVIIFDVLFRLLKHMYEPTGTKVSYVRNITDVDDKINARAAEEGISIRELTERTAAQFHADVAALGCLPPTVEPRATEHIGEMIALIEKLIARGHAYAAEGHVLFDVPSMPEYGQLANRSLDEMHAGARIEVAPYKRDPMDFVLWKPSADNEPGWESPWGRGRPGWHIECSAMSAKHLGETFDIHGGGVDLVFPHHENEVAQSRCAHGTDMMAKVWVHNGFLMVEGQKMSKSLGNILWIDELLNSPKFGGRSWAGSVFRFAMLTTHYRQPIDWTVKNLEAAWHTLEDFSHAAAVTDEAKPSAGVLSALEDDLNTPLAITELHAIRKRIRHNGEDEAAVELAQNLNFLALDMRAFEAWNKAERERVIAARGGIDAQLIASRIEARLAARKAKNWAEADRIRDELAAMGIALMDAKDPATGEIVTKWEVAR